MSKKLRRFWKRWWYSSTPMDPYTISSEVHITQDHPHPAKQSGLTLQGQNYSLLTLLKLKLLMVCPRPWEILIHPVARTWVWIPLGRQSGDLLVCSTPEGLYPDKLKTSSSFPASFPPFPLFPCISHHLVWDLQSQWNWGSWWNWQ